METIYLGDTKKRMLKVVLEATYRLYLSYPASMDNIAVRKELEELIKLVVDSKEIKFEV